MGKLPTAGDANAQISRHLQLVTDEFVAPFDTGDDFRATLARIRRINDASKTQSAWQASLERGECPLRLVNGGAVGR